jgi:short-subunit dehydrogenase
MDIDGAQVLITGASRGIGEAIAREFAGAGASVIACARSEDAIQALANDINGVAVPFDAADPTQVDGFIDKVETEHGPIDVLINNAGVETKRLIEDTSADEIEQAIRINLITPELLTAQMVPRMIERGRGQLVYTSSVAATSGQPGLSVYSSTKGGLTRFAESVRMELRYTNIGVTILHLGPIGTDMWERLEEEPGLEKATERATKFGMLAIAPVEQVAEATLAAVQNNKREVRLPKRMAGGVSMNGAGTRSFEALFRGIDFRVEFGKAPAQTD